MSAISRALALTRANLKELRRGKTPSPSTSARGVIEWRNLGPNYWRTPRLNERFEAMVVKGRDGGDYANVYSYVVFDYSDLHCSCVRIAKAKSVEEGKARAEKEVRMRGFQP
jgi:hypothetical protein